MKKEFISCLIDFCTHDFYLFNTLEKIIGQREANMIYSTILEKMGLFFLSEIKENSGINENTELDVEKIGKLFQKNCEADGQPYIIIENTRNHHIGELEGCIYHEGMKILLGEEKALAFFRKIIGACTANWFQALIKALGKWDKIYTTQVWCECTRGKNIQEERCRIIVEKRIKDKEVCKNE